MRQTCLRLNVSLSNTALYITSVRLRVRGRVKIAKSHHLYPMDDKLDILFGLHDVK